MYSYQQQTAAPVSKSIDVAAWAAVALVVALICAAAGWAIANSDAMSTKEAQRHINLSSREGVNAGLSDGYKEGLKVGRKQAKLAAKLDLQREQRLVKQEGWNAGFTDGYSRAEARAGGESALFGLNTGSAAYSLPDYSEVLDTGLLSDAPGYSSSAFSDFGYGVGTYSDSIRGLGLLG